MYRILVFISAYCVSRVSSAAAKAVVASAIFCSVLAMSVLMKSIWDIRLTSWLSRSEISAARAFWAAISPSISDMVESSEALFRSFSARISSSVAANALTVDPIIIAAARTEQSTLFLNIKLSLL